MANSTNLMALGMHPFLARRVGVSGVSVACGGSSAGSATGMIGHNAVAYVVASNSGSGVLLPRIGGDLTSTTGALIGDRITVYNAFGSTIYVYAPGTMTFVGNGASIVGSVGVSLLSNHGGQFDVLTASTYGFIKTSV